MNFTTTLEKTDIFIMPEITANAVFFVVDIVERVQQQIIRIADYIYGEVMDKLQKLFIACTLSRTYAVAETT